MASTYGNDIIVTDGLVFCVDAKDKHSYPGSGTTWFDLAGSNNGTMTSGASFDSTGDGCINFDGTFLLILF